MSDIVIVGGGIIGLCIAEKLSSMGHHITLIEKEKIAAGASSGNASCLAFSEVIPMASWDTIRQAMNWFIDPEGPFAVVPADLPQTANWLMRFALAARQSVFQHSLQVQAKLMKLGQDSLPNLLKRTQLEHMINTTGALYLYDKTAHFKAAQRGWQLRAKHGVESQVYQGQALHDLQPGLSKDINNGVYVSNYQCATNPYDFCLAIHKQLEQRGVKTIYANVTSLKPNSAHIEITLENHPALTTSKLILAAGPWSGILSQSLGDKVPLIGERGYNTTLPKAAFPELKHPLFLSSQGFVISPLIDGVRVGGASEIARLNRPPDYRRSEAMLKKAKQRVPALQLMGGKQWMGRRPTTPDSLPIIGPATQHKDIIYAFGHGHLGLTQATATAQLVSEAVDGGRDSAIFHHLRASRF